MTRIALPLVLLLSAAPALPTAPELNSSSNEAAAAQTSMNDPVGFGAFSKLLTWLSGLPQAFEGFVSSEKRAQLRRSLSSVADAFGNINDTCLDLARAVDGGTSPSAELRDRFRTLLKHIVDLRSGVRSLAADLGEETGKEGSALAFELAGLTQHRADITDAAMKQVLGGEPDAAAKKLRDAADLAERAQKLVVGFLPMLKQTPAAKP